MRFKRSRQLSLPRFTKTNLQQVLAAKSQRRVAQGKYEYQNLEPRQMLNADIGLNFTTTNDGSAFTSNSLQPNISAAVGENHIVQLVSTGYAIYDKTDGSLLEEGSIGDFFGNGATFADPVIAGSANVEPRIIYDTSFDRWYAIAVDTQDNNDDFGNAELVPESQGNRIWIAASNTPDPLGSWKFGTLQFDNGAFDPDLDFTFRSTTVRPTLSVDEYALTITAQERTFTYLSDNGIPVSGVSGLAIATLPKVALFGGRIETERFEVNRGLSTAFGFEPQFVFDSTLENQTFPLGAADNTFMLAIDGEGDVDTFPVGRQGDELILTEFSRDGIPNVTVDMAITSINRIPIPFYREPDVVRQPTDIIRDRDSTQLNATVVQEGDFIYAAHSVRDVVTDPLTGTQTEGLNAVIRWYKIDTTPEIDPATGEPIFLVDSGVIDGESISGDDSVDLIDPSIDVSANGTVAIGYTATGLNLFPSSYASIGVPIAGVGSQIAFNDPTLLKAGEATFIDNGNHFFGRYTTTVNDPFSPNNFWTFQQYAHDSTPTVNWAIQGTEFGPIDTNPMIDVDPADQDQDIHISLVGDNLEVRIGDQFTGDLVGQYDADGIGVLTVNGTGGMDRFFVHIDDLDSSALSGSWVLVGDNDDKLFVNSVEDTTWSFDGDNNVTINNGRIIANGFVEFHAGTGSDRFELPTANYDLQHDVFGNDGNDVFVVDQNVTGVLFLDGEAGDDVYNIPATSLPTALTIDDSAGTNDQLTTTGTEQVDSIVVTATGVTVNGIAIDFDSARTAWGIDKFAVDALGDDDVFDISSTTNDVFLFGQRGSDTFNVAETVVMSGAAELVLDGGEDANSLNIFQNDALASATIGVTEDLITNMTSAAVRFTATGGSFSDSATSTGISLFGSDTRGDVFEVLSVLAGNDLHVLGRAGDDRFIFENLVDGTAELIGGAGDDRFETNVDSFFDVTIDGSDENAVDRLDITLTTGDDTVVVNENEYIINGVSYPTTSASFTDIEDFAIFGLDGVDTFDINRTTTVASFFGGAGDDIFNVTDLTVTTGTPDINIDGEAGDNTLNVVRNESSGGDVLVNSDSIVGMTIAAINYVATGGVFGLVDLTGSAAADNFVVQTLLGSTLLRIDGQDGDDSFSVVRAPLGDIELAGNIGNDTYRVYVTGDKTRTVTITDPASQAGDDRIEVAFTNGADDIIVDGGTIGLATDTVVLDAEVETLAVEGMDGNDNFDVINPVNPVVELYGQVGDDTYEIQDSAIATGSQLFIFDSVNDENDALVVSGTAGDDVFDINEGSVFVNGNLLIPTTGDNIIGVESIVFDGKEGDDTFNIDSTTRGFDFRGGDGNDIFNVTDLTVTTGASDINIDGEAGDNTLNVVRNESSGGDVLVNSDSISGMTIAAINYVATGGVFGLVDLTGSAAADNFVVQTLLGSTLLRIDGQDGDDSFSVVRAPLGDIELAGNIGNDTYRVYVTGDKTRTVTITDPASQAGDDRIEVAFTNGADDIIVDGGTIGLATDTVVLDAEVETLAVEGMDGNDNFVVINPVNPVVELYGQVGDDTYEIQDSAAATGSQLFIFDSVDDENDALVVSGTAAADVFDINEGSVFVNGNLLIPTSGDNIIGVETLLFDGKEDDDIFNINSTTRGFRFRGGDGNDIFNVTDATVTSGASTIEIDGNAGINTLNVTRNEFTGSQVVVNDTTIEGMTIATIDYSSIDLIDLTGSTAADDFLVETLLPTTLLVINAGAGNDTMLVRRTVLGNVDLNGGTGDDTHRVEVQGDKTRRVRVIDPNTIAGVDRTEVVFTTGADVITVDGRLVGLGSDQVDVDPGVEVLALEGLGGDDRFDIISPENPRLELFGQAGDDLYNISEVSALSSEIAIFDSVNAENDTLLVQGTVNLDEFIIDENLITVNGAIVSNATGDNIIGVEGFTFDGLEADDIFRINSTTRGFTYLGSEGNDQFIITDATVTTGTRDLVIDGGEGNNEMFVSRSAILGGAVAGTEILIEDNRIVGMTTADIAYTATDGVFSRVELNGSSDAAGGEDFDDIFRVNSFTDDTLLAINALGGDDIVQVRAPAEGDVMIDGGLGDDQFLVALGGGVDRLVTVDDRGVNAGFDRIDVFFSDADETIVVNDTFDRIVHAVGNSVVDFDETFESLALHALGGDDRYIVNGTTTDELILAGGEGDDTYELSNVFGDTSVTVIDSVNAENDRLTVDGTNDADVFEINENSFLINGVPFIIDDAVNSNIIGIESLEVNALDGDDTFIVNSATRGFDLNGGAGNDHFQIHDTAADGGADDLVIDGGTGANTMDIQRIEGTPRFVVVNETFIRNVAKSTIRYSATGGSFTGGNGGITIRGLDDLNDSYLIFGLLAENSLELLGGGGNDYHRVLAEVNGDVWMDGAAGRDRYVFFMDEDKSRNFRVADSGDDGAIDRINVFLTQNSDNVVLDGPEVALNNDRMSFTPTIETIEILAGDGDDMFDVRQFDGVRFLRIKGQAGNDRFEVNRANLVENVHLIGEAGNDTFDLVSASQDGFLIANGNEGEDFIKVGEDFYRNGSLNGGQGDDRYDISFADRGERNLVVADTGTSGNDTAIVRASDVTSRLTLRASGINSPNQLIATTRQIESLELIGTDGRDIVTMFSVPVVNMSISTLTGSDIFNLRSNNGAENLAIDTGAEPDIVNIAATAVGSTTTLNAGRDDDLVNIGSTLAADSGNLDTLLGDLTIDLGQGSDRLYINDSQSSGGVGYTLTDSFVRNDASVSNRGFAGLSYTGAEFTQLRGNVQFNRFTVTPSDDVRFILDGNTPQNNSLTVTGSADGRELFSTGDFSGIWTFDAFRDVQFQQFSV